MTKLIREVVLLSLVGTTAFMVVRIAAAPRPANSAVGRRLESLTAERPGDDTLSKVALADAPTLVYVFDERCQHCKTQLPAWRKLAARVAGHAQVAAISTAQLSTATADSLFKGSGIEYLGASSPARLARDFGMRGVPTTIVIDKKHKVREVLGGLQSELALDELFDRVRAP